MVEWLPLNGQSMTVACVWSNGAWSRLCLWITDGSYGLSHLLPRGEDSSMHAWCWKLYSSHGEVQVVHGLCRHVLSKRKALPKMVPTTHGKSHPYHAFVYLFSGCAWSYLDQNLLHNENLKWQPPSLYWWCDCFSENPLLVCQTGNRIYLSKEPYCSLKFVHVVAISCVLSRVPSSLWFF